MTPNRSHLSLRSQQFDGQSLPQRELFALSALAVSIRENKSALASIILRIGRLSRLAKREVAVVSGPNPLPTPSPLRCRSALDPATPPVGCESHRKSVRRAVAGSRSRLVCVGWDRPCFSPFHFHDCLKHQEGDLVRPTVACHS